MIQSYLGELRRELRARGIRGQLCARILTECAHHLQSGEVTAERFGAPRKLANDFAAELGADASRRAAIRTFAALVVAGAVYASSFLSLAFAHPPSEMLASALGAIAFAIVIFAPQVAFVSGALALVRVLRRCELVLPTGELVVLNRRTGVALVFGLATMGGLALYAHEFGSVLAGWWTTFAYASTAAASSLLLAALVPMARAVRLRPLIACQAGDLSTTSASIVCAPSRGASPVVSHSAWGWRCGSPESFRRIRSTALCVVSSRDLPVWLGAPCSGGTSAYAASIDACPLGRRRPISRI